MTPRRRREAAARAAALEAQARRACPVCRAWAPSCPSHHRRQEAPR